MRLTDLALATGLNKSTVIRILDGLGEEGFVEREADSRQYRLGDQAIYLGLAMQGRAHLRAPARPWLVRLAARSGDTALLSVRSGIEALCIDREFGNYPIQANYLDVGSRRPLGAGAGSLALLAWLPDDEVMAVLDQLEPVWATRYPRLCKSFLLDQIAQSRHQGFVMLLDVVVERMGGIAMPILGVDGRPMGAISIAALTERLSLRKDMLCESLGEAVAALSPRVLTGIS
jgi:DNA-binding IclR family transcriptional regulator